MENNEMKILGALEDTRPEEAKKKDFLFKETVASAAPVNWVEKKPSEWRRFSSRNQDGSSSCVEQTAAKLAEVSYFNKTGQKIPFSAGFYKLRSNYPGEGMLGVDAFEIWRKKGMPLEALAPSQNVGEAVLNAIEISAAALETATVFKLGNYVQYEPRIDFEAIASTIQQTGKAVMVWFEFTDEEWSRLVPVILGPTPNRRHSVAAVDFTLYNGKKALIIEDSAHFGGLDQRVITEDFFKVRNFFAAYPINLVSESNPSPKPQYAFNRDLKFGETSEDVKALQGILQYSSLFPSNISPTGYFGSITAKAVLAFQKKYAVGTDEELDGLQGRLVGPKTRAKLNELFA